MISMKRVGLVLFGIVVAVLLTAPLDVAVVGGKLRLQPNVALAADPPGCPNGQLGPVSPTANYDCPIAGGSVVNGKYVAQATPKVDPLANPDKSICVAVPVFSGKNQGKCPKGQAEIINDASTGGAIVYYVKLVLELLNIAIGGIIVLMLVVAGIQYITSAADSGQVKSAKDRIQNAIVALILYLMMFAILSFLVPGGIFV